jgi:hypothetical protein
VTVLALALAACAPTVGEPLFAVSRSGPALDETTAIDRAGRWTSSNRAGLQSRSQLSRQRFERLRAVLAAAALEVVTRPCDADPDSETLNVADHERGRYVTYVRPCLVPDPETERAIACLNEAPSSSDDRFVQICGESPRP